MRPRFPRHVRPLASRRFAAAGLVAGLAIVLAVSSTRSATAPAPAPVATPAPAPAATPAPAAPAPAASPAPATAPAPAAPAPPPSPVRDMRSKLSAGDLLSAESMLEVYRAEHGEDGAWLNGLSWLARGAWLTGDTAKARRYADDVRGRCAAKLAAGAKLEDDRDLETALGAAIEVRAQLLERARGARAATDYVRGELTRIERPEGLRVRLNKRIDLMTLEGTPAPELVIEDWVGDRPPSLASMRGYPVVLFVFAEWCGDCKAMAPALARVRKKYAAEGFRFVALTRYYESDAADRVREKAAIDSVWRAVYPDLGAIPVVISTASAERYGGSSTPTFVFIDREGIVRRYTPTRLTEAEFDRTLTPWVR